MRKSETGDPEWVAERLLFVLLDLIFEPDLKTVQIPILPFQLSILPFQFLEKGKLHLTRRIN